MVEPISAAAPTPLSPLIVRGMRFISELLGERCGISHLG
jgi:hypothetical protein